ncbi:MAG: hypothetical protein M5U28_20450 [Sandaracinaceae bacterium]|nr:hypothetical protein [Sandaracinaceae bacterium]
MRALLSSCSVRAGLPAPPPAPAAETTPAPRPAYALVVHGGAGALPRDLEPDARAAYVASLSGALRAGCRASTRGPRASTSSSAPCARWRTTRSSTRAAAR